MNIKKIVSAVTAFALSATMFAGFSVQAAEAVEVYERGTTTAWSDTDLTDWVASGTTASIATTEDSIPTGISITGTNAEYSATKDVSTLINDNDLVNIIGTWTAGGAGGRSGSYDYISLGEDVALWSYGQDNSTSIAINGTATDIGISGRGHTFTFDVTINTQTKQITSFKVDDTERITEATALTNGTVNSIVMGHYKAGRENYAVTNLLSAISINTTAQEAAATADYTIKYVDSEDNELASSTSTGVVGLAPTIDMDDFDVDGQRYICVSNDLGEKTIAENLVITVTCRAAENYDIMVVPSTDANTSLYTGTVVEHDTFTYSYPKYLTDNNNKVIAECNSTTYSVTETPTESKTITVDYTEYEGDDAWFVEAEDVLTGTTYDRVSQLSGSYSVWKITSGNIFTVPEDGVYTVTAVAVNRNTNQETYLSVYRNSESDENLIKKSDNINVSYKYPMTIEETGVVLNADDTIYIVADQNTVLDYVLVTKTGDAPVLTVAKTSTDITTVPTSGTVTADLVAEDNAALETATEDVTVDLTGVVTLYIKVDNAVNGVVPTVTLADEAKTEIIPVNAQASTINDATYYVYQFVGFDTIVGATIDYAGVTATVAE